MFLDPYKFVHFNCNANEGVPGIGQGGTCFSVDHEGDYALILSGETTDLDLCLLQEPAKWSSYMGKNTCGFSAG